MYYPKKWWQELVFLELIYIANLLSYHFDSNSILTRFLLLVSVFFTLLVLALAIYYFHLPKKTKKEIKAKNSALNLIHSNFKLSQIKRAMKKQGFSNKMIKNILLELKATKKLNHKFKSILKKHK